MYYTLARHRRVVIVFACVCVCVWLRALHCYFHKFLLLCFRTRLTGGKNNKNAARVATKAIGSGNIAASTTTKGVSHMNIPTVA